ncbi:MAG TPA: nucleoside-diphosphate kinase [Anaerolineales bacterium]|nr:nucleoside-diphosphate kinase [Anaerolineales bacterium]
MEKTLVLIKPDGVQRGLIGEIITRLERRGLRLAASRFMWVSEDLARAHYAELEDRNFFPDLIAYITSSPVMAMVWEGPRAIEAVRQTMGKTDPIEALPGTVRHDFGLQIGRNLTHASDGDGSAKKEVGLWFGEDDLVAWDRENDRWHFE